MKKIFISSERLEQFGWNFSGDVADDNIKSKKTHCFTLTLEKTIFEKRLGRIQIGPPAFYELSVPIFL